VKTAVPVPNVPSGLVTSRLVAPAVAVVPTVMLTVSCPHALTVVEFTVIPELEKAAVAPVWKFDPAIVSVSVRPCSAAEGVAKATTGRDHPWISFEYDALGFPLVS
jgi:hypothetical protein